MLLSSSLLAFVLVGAIGPGHCQVALSDANEARSRAAAWLSSQWVSPRDGVPVSRTGGFDETTNGGGGNTARVITGLQLADNGWIFSPANQPKADFAIRQMNNQILNALLRTGNMTSMPAEEGAEYVNALLATCQNPSDFYGHNLIAMLTRRINNVPAGPDTKNVAQIIAGVTALCTARAPVPPAAIQRINSELKPTSGGCAYCVEGSSMAVLAMKCLQDRPSPGSPDSLIHGIMTRQIAYVKGKQQADGGFGDLFATNLAVQAANAVGTANLPINVASALSYIMQEQDKATGSFSNPVLTAFVLPTLIGRSALDSSGIPCPAARSLDDPVPSGRIRIILVVEDLVYAQRSIETKLDTAPGQTILQVLNEQTAKHPRTFKFATAAGNGGTTLTGINSVVNDVKNNWTWKVTRVPATGTNPAVVTALDRVQLASGDRVIFRFSR